MSAELAALRTACDDLESLVGEFSSDDWARVTRCAPMTVRELVAHVALGLQRTANALETESAGEPSHDRVSWWRYGQAGADIARQVIEGGREEAAKRSDAELVDWLREEADRAMSLASKAGGGRVLEWKGSLERTIRADELFATRVLEFGVHSMDLGHATLKGERLGAGPANVICETLDGLLGEPLPRSMGWDRRTYVLTGTGRRPLSPNERHVLGPLAARFPLVS